MMNDNFCIDEYEGTMVYAPLERIVARHYAVKCPKTAKSDRFQRARANQDDLGILLSGETASVGG
jgi:hypothetical protein